MGGVDVGDVKFLEEAGSHVKFMDKGAMDVDYRVFGQLHQGFHEAGVQSAKQRLRRKQSGFHLTLGNGIVGGIGDAPYFH